MIGYRLQPDESYTPRTIQVVFILAMSDPLEKDYTVFVHLADATGVPLSQGDHPPVRGLYPTSRWQPGEILADFHELPIDANVSPGEYQVLVGMYTIEPSGIQSSPPIYLTTVNVSTLSPVRKEPLHNWTIG